jgi:hypothetical protein
MIGMEVGYVNMSEILAHRDNIGDHSMRITEKLGSIYQDGIPFTIDQRGVAVKTQVTVKKYFKL